MASWATGVIVKNIYSLQSFRSDGQNSSEGISFLQNSPEALQERELSKTGEQLAFLFKGKMLRTHPK